MQLGRYTLDEILGEGGFGQVWRGTLTGEMGFAKTVAIKVLHPELSLDEERTAALVHEALLGARLKHRNIVEVHEFTRIEGRLLMVMELVDGETLSGLLSRHPQGLEAARARDIILQLAQGLAHAHDLTDEDGGLLGLVHRDLKPSNIMIDHDGTVKICDFGIALSSLAERHTATGMLRGSHCAIVCPVHQLVRTVASRSAGSPESSVSGNESAGQVSASAIMLWARLCTAAALSAAQQRQRHGSVHRGIVAPEPQRLSAGRRSQSDHG